MGGAAVTCNGSTCQSSAKRHNVVVMTNQDDVKEFLSSRRAKITPEQAGLPDPGRPANNARFVFLDERSEAFFPDWEKAADDIVAINQIEVHPYFQQREVQAANLEHGILTQAWSPIGGITFYRDSGHTSALEDSTIAEIAGKHAKSPAQVMLRWHLQEGRQVIPKSTNPARIAENIGVFDFNLTSDELSAIDGLDTGRRGGPEPEAMTLEAFGRPIPED
jgi:Aldo/keto reductase family